MKKVIVATFLAFALIFIVGQSNQAEAREVYVGSYRDGTAVYLLTETIDMLGDSFNCTVRAGRDYLDYNFRSDGRYSNSEGYHGNVYDGSSPVARAIHEYVKAHY